MNPPFITLLTDFGLKDGNVGVMKGVIWGIAPQAQIADLSHLVTPQNIAEAALILFRSAPYFPDGTIHVVVVDPGVGTARRPIAGRLGGQFFVGPDNGVVTAWLEWTEGQGLPWRFVHLDQPQYWRAQVSHVFHGRDIFAPVAGHLATGVPLSDLGTPIDEALPASAILRLNLPQPQRTTSGWRGEVIHIDHFGNISTNLRRECLGDLNVLQGANIHLCGIIVSEIVQTFGEHPPGALIALYGSTGHLIISVVNGDAAGRLGAKPGDPVEIDFGKIEESG